MKILLINNNPVVSRLTALSARKENIELDEIQEVTELSSDSYDIVFVDGDSWSKDVRDVIKEHIKVKKSVLFYAEGDDDDKKAFDISILKPFLPSEVSAVIRSIEESEEEDTSANKESNFDILADAKDSSRDELVSLEESKSKVEVETKTEKEELFATLSEESPKLEEGDFDSKLEEAFPLKINSLDDELFALDDVKDSENLTATEEKKDELFDLDEDLFAIDDNLKSDDKLLELDDIKEEPLKELEKDTKELEKVVAEEKEELFEYSEKREIEEEVTATKILDEVEIENIKGLLSEDDSSSEEMKLEDLMTPTSTVPAIMTNEIDEVVKEKKEKREKKEKKSKKSKDSSVIESELLIDTLTALSVESLRELLAGTRVNISIKFPKAK